jgi:hypothetical protein
MTATAIFSEDVFGERLARALDALLLIQQADTQTLLERGGIRACLRPFAQPTGTSFYEADALTHHFLISGLDVSALVTFHRGIVGVAEALDGLNMQSIRALLCERFASSHE